MQIRKIKQGTQHNTKEIRDLTKWLETNIDLHPRNTMPFGLKEEALKNYKEQTKEYSQKLATLDVLIDEIELRVEEDQKEIAETFSRDSLARGEFQAHCTTFIEKMHKQILKNTTPEMRQHPRFKEWNEKVLSNLRRDFNYGLL